MSYEEIKEMTLQELLPLHEALKAICEKHERDLRPLYNAVMQEDRRKWVEINAQLQHAKGYYNVVFDALKYRTFKTLDEYTPKKKASTNESDGQGTKKKRKTKDNSKTKK